ncbi:hypothetical protein [Clostridium sp. D46t1_190503_E9]|uniref:hypothetical protein n=1 Tax=Clostridium sp. D46t1_190503_E9 TaxID=2787137 RepID=UPI00189AE7AA|nr:hypothetical protein [Clostridium sp. D46t1_190503_E9]
MKRIFLFILASLSVFTVSCNNTKILEENTKDNEVLNKYKITERNVNINYDDRAFEPLFYDDDGVNGILDTRKQGTVNDNEVRVPYILNEDGVLVKEENKWFSKEGANFIRRRGGKLYKGLYSEGLHTRDNTFYYMDLEKNVKFELVGYDKMYYNVIDSFEYRYEDYFQIKDDYYIEEINNVTENYESKEEKSILIVDIKNKTYYTTDIIKTNPNKFYYDEKEKSLMALDSLGKIKKVILKDGKIYFEDFGYINISKIGIESLFDNKKPMFNGYIISEDNLIFQVRGNERFEYILYNIRTDELIFLNKEVFIKSQIEDTEFFLVSTNNKVYLAKINDNYEFDLIYRLAGLENYDSLTVKANKDESSIFFALEAFDHSEGAKSILKDSKYFFLEIEEK